MNLYQILASIFLSSYEIRDADRHVVGKFITVQSFDRFRRTFNRSGGIL